MRDVRRIDFLWSDCRHRFGKGGDFLFGAPSIADAMYAPVVTRFRTYDVPVSQVAQGYMNNILGHPLMQEWDGLAEAERWRVNLIENDLKSRGAHNYLVP